MIAHSTGQNLMLQRTDTECMDLKKKCNGAHPQLGIAHRIESSYSPSLVAWSCRIMPPEDHQLGSKDGMGCASASPPPPCRIAV